MLSANDEERIKLLERAISALEVRIGLKPIKSLREKKWYENIPDGGVLCWVKDEDGEPFFRINVIFERNGDFYKSKHLAYHYAKPLTKQEIQVFMDNAPE